jgi:hypothetical protein
MNKTKKTNKSSCFPCFKSKNKIKPIVESIEKAISFIDDGDRSTELNLRNHSKSVQSLEQELNKTAFQTTFATNGAFDSKVEGGSLGDVSITSNIIKQTVEGIKKDKMVTSNIVPNYTKQDYTEYKTKERFFSEHYKNVSQHLPEFKGVDFNVFCDILKKHNIQGEKIHYGVIYDLDLYKKDNLEECAVNVLNINQCERGSFIERKGDIVKPSQREVEYSKKENDVKSVKF